MSTRRWSELEDAMGVTTGRTGFAISVTMSVNLSYVVGVLDLDLQDLVMDLSLLLPSYVTFCHSHL